jgi:triacylglycerol lipase
MKSKNIVFVHGLFGWGPGELGGLPYWGDALAQFEGVFNTHEVKCGPISSFHDRACEVFAQIKGTQVDYGAAHSEEAGHDQKSRDYSGKTFVQNWSARLPKMMLYSRKLMIAIL